MTNRWDAIPLVPVEYVQRSHRRKAKRHDRHQNNDRRLDDFVVAHAAIGEAESPTHVMAMMMMPKKGQLSLFF